MAEEKNDEKLLTRIRWNLFACEAQFHRKCLIDYMQSSDKWRSEDKDACEMQGSLVEAHKNAFSDVCAIVEAGILIDGKVMKMSTLNDTYKSSLSKSTHNNPHYCNENLKTKLLTISQPISVY